MTPIARVFVNNIEVGSLPAADYDALVSAVYRERRLYVNFGLAALDSAWRLVLRALEVQPLFWFGLIAGLVFAAPAEFAAYVDAWRTAPAQALASTAQVLLGSSLFLALLGGPIVDMLRGRNPGDFCSPFENAIADRLRHRLEVPTYGTLRVDVERVSEAPTA